MQQPSLWNKLAYLELALIALIWFIQYFWAKQAGVFDSLFEASSLLLALAALTGFLASPRISAETVEDAGLNDAISSPHDSGVPYGDRRQVTLLTLQILLLSFSCALGAFRLFAILFLVLAAKCSMHLRPPHLVAFIIFIGLAHFCSTEWAIVNFAHMHGVVLPLSKGSMLLVHMEGEAVMICGLVFVAMLGKKIVAERVARQAAQKYSRELQELAVTVERMRIARDMHDKLGHTLTSLNVQLELTDKLLSQRELEQAKQSLGEARMLSKNSFQEVRAALHCIRESDIDLQEATDALVTRTGEQRPIDFDIDIAGGAEFSPAARHHLFCLIQECITNVQKHSKATKVTISLKQDDGRARLVVEDNGVGIARSITRSIEGLDPGFGIRGMRERAESLGGEFRVTSAPGKGTRVEVVVPI